ncbi:MAG: translation elongation factor Ts [Fimbriimonas sp.]|nr:translation elongation factor Ts [Fimbriimonas sp.]
MANYSAQDVKKLREDTDAPMMECKAALDESEGDFDKAKNILREKGKAAAAKRSDRSTAAGVVAIASSEDGKTVGAIVLESETDFVARNEDFIAIAQGLAEIYRDNEVVDPAKVKEIVEAAVGKIRENIKLSKGVRFTSANPIATYVHHDKTKGSVVTSEGAVSDAVHKVAVQVVAFPPDVLKKEDLSQDKLDQEIEIETQRAINEGKDENLARNIAKGRVNKEFIKRAVLVEQPYYVDPSKSVAQFLAEEAKGTQLTGFAYLAVGQA